MHVCAYVCMCAASTSEMAVGSPQRKHPNHRKEQRTSSSHKAPYLQCYHDASQSDISKSEELQKRAALGWSFMNKSALASLFFFE